MTRSNYERAIRQKRFGYTIYIGFIALDLLLAYWYTSTDIFGFMSFLLVGIAAAISFLPAALAHSKWEHFLMKLTEEDALSPTHRDYRSWGKIWFFIALIFPVLCAIWLIVALNENSYYPYG